MGNGQGLFIRNESDRPLLYVLSQLTPLHWGRVDPGEEAFVQCGKVWFTVSVGDWDPDKVPTKTGVAARVATIAAGTLMMGAAGVAITGVISGVTASLGCKMDGVYADGRTLVVQRREEPPSYFFVAVEYVDKSNKKVVRMVEEGKEEEKKEDSHEATRNATAAHVPVVAAKMVIPDVDS